MLVKEDWTVAVFKCEKTGWKKVLVALADAVDRLQKEGKAKSFHYTIREIDQTDGKPWISFRVYRDRNFSGDVEGALRQALIHLVGIGNYEVPPTSNKFVENIQFYPFDFPDKVESYWDDAEGWKMFCYFLNKLSLLTVELAQKGQFKGNKRCDMAHLFANMLATSEAYDNRGIGYVDKLDRKDDQLCCYYKANP
jgi:hypothetical protein